MKTYELIVAISVDGPNKPTDILDRFIRVLGRTPLPSETIRSCYNGYSQSYEFSFDSKLERDKAFLKAQTVSNRANKLGIKCSIVGKGETHKL